MSGKVVGVTGAGGRIGSLLAADLSKAKYTVKEYHYDVQTGTGLDLSKPERVKGQFDGVHTLIHMAGSPEVTTPWEQVLTNNIQALHTVLEECRGAGVKRFIFASTNHTQMSSFIGDWNVPESIKPDTTPVGLDTRPAPDSLYGVSKLFGENLTHYYASRWGLEVVCLRIGWAGRENAEDPQSRLEFLRELKGTECEGEIDVSICPDVLSLEPCAPPITGPCM
eukprot:GFYU01019624.1.p1 GENE.GFYU01019624.1~~GFYU01019624.1.p1  ORF type:complete len:223 (+),score=43.91 GFYU01019624.1:56-724(+)